jgi:hypothetical protein
MSEQQEQQEQPHEKKNSLDVLLESVDSLDDIPGFILKALELIDDPLVDKKQLITESLQKLFKDNETVLLLLPGVLDKIFKEIEEHKEIIEEVEEVVKKGTSCINSFKACFKGLFTKKTT